jgi:hypothetical protein
MGTPLAAGESLLLILSIRASKAPALRSGLFREFDWWNSIRRLHQFQLKKCAIDRKPETIFVLGT